MRSTICHGLLVLSLLLGAVSPAAAEEDPKPKLTTSKLAQAVLKSPVDLYTAAARSELKKGVVLRAAFALDTRGKLVARILLRSAEGEASAFEEWTGQVYDDCWTPRRRFLVQPEALAQARRLDALVRGGKRSVLAAITSSRGPQHEDKRWPGTAVSIEPTTVDGETRFVSLVVHEERLRRVTQAREAGEILASVAVAEDPAQVAVDAHPRVTHMPPLAVPEGIWFFADRPPTLEGMRGSPVLIAVSDPG